MRRLLIPGMLPVLATALSVGPGRADEPETTKIVLIGKDRDHPFGTHEYMHECVLLARCLEQTENVETVVVNGWPKEPGVLEDVDAIVLYTAIGGNVLLGESHRRQADALLDDGVGLAVIHWSTGADGDEIGRRYLEVSGGWFHLDWARLLTTELPLRQADAEHPICRGWKSYDLHDEYYLDMKIHPDARAILVVTADDAKEHVVAWVHHRKDANDGRSFGTVLGHFHRNFGIESFRRSLVNGILWTAHREIPPGGAPCAITPKDMVLAPDTRKKAK